MSAPPLPANPPFIKLLCRRAVDAFPRPEKLEHRFGAERRGHTVRRDAGQLITMRLPEALRISARSVTRDLRYLTVHVLDLLIFGALVDSLFRQQFEF